MRTYKNITFEKNRDVIKLMHTLSDPNTTIKAYRSAFYELGKALGSYLNKYTAGKLEKTMLACASEDTDWLAHGLLDSLYQKNISLAVFWNERVTLDFEKKIEYSPIVKSYIEPIDSCQTLIIVKSIISTSCVIKTQITRLIDSLSPENIYIVSPVMYKDAISNLKKEFPESISKKFYFLTFAIDSERDKNGQVLPGIGGMVYPKLGLGDSHEKNKYMPNLIKERI